MDSVRALTFKQGNDGMRFHYVIRVSQRPAGCANLLVDQPMIRSALLHDLL